MSGEHKYGPFSINLWGELNRSGSTHLYYVVLKAKRRLRRGYYEHSIFSRVRNSVVSIPSAFLSFTTSVRVVVVCYRLFVLVSARHPSFPTRHFLFMFRAIRSLLYCGISCLTFPCHVLGFFSSLFFSSLVFVFPLLRLPVCTVTCRAHPTQFHSLVAHDSSPILLPVRLVLRPHPPSVLSSHNPLTLVASHPYSSRYFNTSLTFFIQLLPDNHISGRIFTCHLQFNLNF